MNEELAKRYKNMIEQHQTVEDYLDEFYSEVLSLHSVADLALLVAALYNSKLARDSYFDVKEKLEEAE